MDVVHESAGRSSRDQMLRPHSLRHMAVSPHTQALRRPSWRHHSDGVSHAPQVPRPGHPHTAKHSDLHSIGGEPRGSRGRSSPLGQFLLLLKPPFLSSPPPPHPIYPATLSSHLPSTHLKFSPWSLLSREPRPKHEQGSRASNSSQTPSWPG